MKHSTFELYNIDPSSLRKLPYEEALQAKIDGARFAMRQYRAKADKIYPKFSDEYNKWMKKYKTSEKALEHSRKLLEELDLY